MADKDTGQVVSAVNCYFMCQASPLFSSLVLIIYDEGLCRRTLTKILFIF